MVSSCYHENKQEIIAPEKFLSEDELVNIITDIQLAEGVISYQRLQKVHGSKEYKDTVYRVVLNKYGLTVNEVNKIFDYYNSDPQNMELMYEKVLSNLSKLQTEVELSAKQDTVKELKNE